MSNQCNNQIEWAPLRKYRTMQIIKINSDGGHEGLSTIQFWKKIHDSILKKINRWAEKEISLL